MTNHLKAALALGSLALTLNACGNIPVGSVPLPDFAIAVPADLQSSVSLTSPVIYIDQNQAEGQNIPALVNAVTITGTAEYKVKPLGSFDVQTVKLFVRQNFDSGCTHIPGVSYVVCTEDGTSNLIGDFDFVGSNPTDFAAGGPALLSALRAGRAYFGFQVTGGKVNAGDQVLLTNMRAVAKF